MSTPDTCRKRAGARWSSCRCQACRDRHARLSKRGRVLRAEGTYPPDRSAEAIAHIGTLLDLGWLPATISEAAGLERSVLHMICRDIAAGKPRTVRRATAARILAIKPQAVPSIGQAWVPATGAARRLQALAAIGWSLRDLMPELDMADTGISRLRSGDRQACTAADVHAAVCAAYSRLSMTVGPSPRAAHEARARGWAPPLAWDDETIDDPNATPYVAEADHSSPIPENVEFLLGLHPLATAEQIADRLGVSKSGVQKVLRRHGRDDLAATLRRNAEVAA